MGERGQRNREEIEFLFFSRLRRTLARVLAASQLSSAPDKTAKLRRLDEDRCISLCLPSPLLSCGFSEHYSITHLYGLLVVSIVANDISIPTVYATLPKCAIFHFEFTSFGMKDRRLTSICDRPKFEFDNTASELALTEEYQLK